MSRFFGTRWPRLLLVAALAVAVATLLPKFPQDQTLHVDLGDLATRVTEIGIRWAPSSDHVEKKANPDARSANIEDWTGEVTFRYEKSGAPRIVEEKMRAADGDYVVEIEVGTQDGSAVTTKSVTLNGGATTLDLTGMTLPSHREDATKDAAP